MIHPEDILQASYNLFKENKAEEALELLEKDEHYFMAVRYWAEKYLRLVRELRLYIDAPSLFTKMDIVDIYKYLFASFKE